jgi:hypothetical protein
MADLVLVALIVAFTALCVAYIWWCDRIIGPDEPTRAPAPVDQPEAVAS